MKMLPLTLTINNGRLSLNQRVFYEQNGYLVIKRFMPVDILERCSKRFDDIVSRKVSPGAMNVVRDLTDRTIVNKVQDIAFDEVFVEYIENKKLLDIVESFTGPNIIASHSMLIAKPPDAGSGSSRHPPHQDLYYFPYRPADRIVATWTAIEPCDELNGCLYVSPGSHLRKELYPHGYPKDLTVNKLYYGIQDLPESTSWVSLEAEPGDVIFFHPLLIHGSGVNRSTRSRKAISCHYAAAECQYIEIRGTVHELLHDEFKAIAEKRYPGAGITYPDLIRMTCKIVRGIRSSL